MQEENMVKKSGKSKKGKSWREKLEKAQEAKLVYIPPEDAETSAMAKRFGTGKMLIPKPLDVDALIRKIPRGRLATKSQIREKLAKDFDADFTCPLTTGIFIRIAAEAAEEDRHAGKNSITPYWRVVGDDGSLNEKFPGGVESQSALLEEEGLRIVSTRGMKAPKVENLERYLTRFK